MNFNLIIILVLVTGCGVKGDPKSPPGSPTPSVMENYPDVETDNKLHDDREL